MHRFFVPMLLLWAAWPTSPCAALERGPLLQSLRPSARQDVASYELGPLADLPGYDLDISLRDDLAAYSLRETVEYTNQTGAPLKDVVLRVFANANVPAPGPVTLAGARCQEQTCTIYRPHPSVIRLQLAAALPAGARIHIQLELQGTLRQLTAADTDLLGQGVAGLPAVLGREKEGDHGLLSLGDGIATLSHFYAVVAQRTDRGWQISPQKPFGDLGSGGLGFVRASIHAPKGVSVISSGVASPLTADGVHNVRAALVRDFAVIASRGLTQRTRQVGDVSVRSHFLAAHAQAGERVLDAAAHALSVYEEHFGGYPYADLDVVEAALVGGAGGCEFSGLVTVASMLYRQLPAALQRVEPIASALEFTTAHEVAHQYWYGLVGSDARAQPFQDEALTQWSAALYFERRYGAERAARELDGQVGMNYRLMRMLGQPDGVVDRPADAFESSLAYAGLVYGKAAFLYPALRRLVGDTMFFNALRSYVLRNRFRTADKYALFDIVAELSGRSGKVRALVHRWLMQAYGDRDLGVAVEQDRAAAKGGPDERRRMRLLLTALTAPPGAPTSAGKDAKPGEGTLNAEQLTTLLQSLSTNTSGASVEQLQGALGGSGEAAPDVSGLKKLMESTGQNPSLGAGPSPELMRELSSSSEQQGL